MILIHSEELIMKTYKVTEIRDDGERIRVLGIRKKYRFFGQKYHIDEMLPSKYKNILKAGDNLHVHFDRVSCKVGYGFKNNLYLTVVDLDYLGAKYVIKEFWGINNWRLDRALFNLAVAKSLAQRRIVPTFSSAANLVLHTR